MIKSCTYCGAGNDTSEKLCTQCGASLPILSLPKRIVSAITSPFREEVAYEVTGIDVSTWQGDINWDVAKSKINFAIIRAGYGNSSVDSRLEANRLACTQKDIPFGLYWYLKPSKNWYKHANAFFETWEANPGQIEPVLDVESNEGLSKAEMENFVLKLKKRFETLSGTPPMIYTSKGFWDANFPMTNWAKNLPLWIAHWSSYISEPSLPKEWVDINNPRTWLYWQWTSKGIGASFGCASNHVDLNRFNGTAEEFSRRYNVDVGPVEPPPEVTKIRITGLSGDTTLHMRSDIWGTSIGKTWNGATFTVMTSAHDTDGGLWYQIGPTIWVHSNFAQAV